MRGKWGRLCLRWLFPIAGLLALIWFLVRVVPKPNRATYPCQRLAFPLASSFVIWLTGTIATVVAFRRARYYLARTRHVVAAICVAVGIGAAFVTGNSNKTIALADIQDRNEPIGIARGINAGRVVWVHDPTSTDWDGPDSGDGHWWQSSNTNMDAVDRMMSRAIRALAVENNSFAAWDRIFRYFNRNHGKAERGYQSGEKIAIKINLTTCNASYGRDRGTRVKTNYLDKTGDTSPQMILALLRQLVNVVGVAQTDIFLGDPVSYFPEQWREFLAAEFPDVHFLDHYPFSGRTQVQHSTTPLYWSTSNADDTDQDFLPVSFAAASYIINFAVLKGHSAGITVCAKNHYGSLIRNPVGLEQGVQKNYYNLHDSLPNDWARPGRGYYRAIVDLMGHSDLGGKTVLSLIDGLYGGYYWEGTPYRWNMTPFNGDWPSSLFVSQDQVAIDSVAYDFLLTEWPHVVEGGAGEPGSLQDGAQDYLHEAALAHDPPSGTVYDPEKDGTPLTSLGVHEHWNNSEDKQYSRNLGLGDGIELISLEPIQDSDSDDMADNWENENFGTLDRDGAGDFDGDGHSDFQEYLAGTRPTVAESPLIIYLKKGFNLFSYPVDIPPTHATCSMLLSSLGTPEEIESLARFNIITQQFETCGVEDIGDFPITAGQGYVLRMKTDKTVSFSGAVSPATFALTTGLEIIGRVAPYDNLTSYKMLLDIGKDAVISIQRFNTVTGFFETAGFDPDGKPVGVDFPILPGEGYFIHMKQKNLDFRP